MRYALGIDGGGSKCEAVLVDEHGNAVGRGRGGPTHRYYDPPEVIRGSYTQAVAEATAGAKEAEVWVAAYLSPDEAHEVIGQVVCMGGYLATNEQETAFACVQESWGMVVLSGTGSFVHARTADGRRVYFGALGPVLGDYGSAYAIGLAGLRAAFASGWTAARRTTLAEAVPRTLGARDARGVFDLVYVKGMSRREIATIAEVVDAEAEGGDAVAARCLREAADELAALAADAVDELGMRDLSFPVIAIGGVAQRSRIWWERMCGRVSEVAPGARPVIPRVQPAVGAALLALREMGVEWSPDLVERIVETSGPAGG
jgi:N-acetylglucosamine kinase